MNWIFVKFYDDELVLGEFEGRDGIKGNFNGGVYECYIVIFCCVMYNIFELFFIYGEDIK